MPDMDTARSEHLPQGPVVDADWLADHLDDVVVVDASIMGERGAATGIPGARRFDLDGPLSDQEADIPHTMLCADDFAQRLGELGIGDDAVVVAYDRQGLFSSARAWWMLRAAGVGTPYVLDGGLPAWIASPVVIQGMRSLSATECRNSGSTMGQAIGCISSSVVQF